MLKIVGSGAAIALLWGYNRFGYAGENEVKMCPHEKHWVEKGMLYDTYYYEPNDCYLTVYDKSVRPIKFVVTDDECWGFGDECAGKKSEEEQRIEDEIKFQKLLDQAPTYTPTLANNRGKVSFLLTPNGVMPSGYLNIPNSKEIKRKSPILSIP